MSQVIAIAKATSGNAKIGDAATTYAAQVSCPTSCVFFDGGGCYAETGRVGKFVTSPLNEAAAEVGASALDVAIAEAAAIDDLQSVDGRPLRLHTVGDCATDETARIVSAAAERYMERGGGPVWTYTHAWRVVERASWGRVSVLASCETPVDVELAEARGYATALVVEEFAGDRLYEIAGRHGAQGEPATPPDGVLGHETPPRVLPCPAQTRDVPCSDCRLCMDDQGLRARGYSIGFELHGIPYAIRQARLALRQPDDPHRRETAETQLRRLIAERPALSAREAGAALSMNVSYAGQLIAHLRDGAEHPSVLRRRRYDRARAAA